MTISIWGAVAAFVAAMGIPSAVMGLVVWRMERRIDFLARQGVNALLDD